MAYWLVKSEPFKYSWDRMVADGVTHWNGVRNHQASNNLKAMRLGDRAFFYHSNIGKAVVGIVEVAREAYPDPTADNGPWVCVDMRAVAPLPRPVSLAEIKAHPALADMPLLRLSRLSVSAVSSAHWQQVMAMAQSGAQLGAGAA